MFILSFGTIIDIYGRQQTYSDCSLPTQIFKGRDGVLKCCGFGFISESRAIGSSQERDDWNFIQPWYQILGELKAEFGYDVNPEDEIMKGRIAEREKVCKQLDAACEHPF